MAGILTKVPRTVNNMEREAFIELLPHIVHDQLEFTLSHCFYNEWQFKSWPPTEQEINELVERKVKDLGLCFNMWRARKEKCNTKMTVEDTCLSCLKIKNHNGSYLFPAISATSPEKLLISLIWIENCFNFLPRLLFKCKDKIENDLREKNKLSIYGDLYMRDIVNFNILLRDFGLE